MGNTLSSSSCLTQSMSFSYEDLLKQVKEVRHEIIELRKVINKRWKNEKDAQNQIRSRCLTFIDPYGHSITNSCMDHELIFDVIKTYKKNYISEHLQRWIKIGRIENNLISSLKDTELNSTVSKYKQGQQFVAYGEIIVLIRYCHGKRPRRLVLQVYLSDDTKKLKSQLRERENVTHIELKSFRINADTELCDVNWDTGITLKRNDTVLSAKLYENHCIVMAKILKQNDSNGSNIKYDYQIFVQILTRKTISLRVNSYMNISAVKELLEKKEGISASQQRLIFKGKELTNEKLLADYEIDDETTIHMLMILRGGMYHFTSGRQDFNRLPHHSIEAIKNIFAYKSKDLHNLNEYSSEQLQDAIIDGQDILGCLFNSIKHFPKADLLINLQKSSLFISSDDMI